MAAEQHHHVRSGVRTDAGQGQQPGLDFLVRELVRRCVAQLFQVDCSRRDVARERP
jgi:hypothetical protein